MQQRWRMRRPDFRHKQLVGLPYVCITCHYNVLHASLVAQMSPRLRQVPFPALRSGSCGKACPADNVCQGGTCMCAATGTCTVTSILPMVNSGATPYPYRQVSWNAVSKTTIQICHCPATASTAVIAPAEADVRGAACLLPFYAAAAAAADPLAGQSL